MRYRGFFPLLLTALLILSICVTGAAAIEKPLTQAQSDFTAEGALGAGCSESALGDLLADAALEETRGADGDPPRRRDDWHAGEGSGVPE